jgi:membrane fusion protein, peptide pheromone/bacteriocin exporter
VRYKIENLEDLTDAKSFVNGYLASCSYKFLKYIVYIIAAILISIVTWSLYAEKEVAITASGEIDRNLNICKIYIENTSIGSIKENDDVRIEIISLSRSVYGVINSTIDSISHDVVVDQNSGMKYYTASCILDCNVLTDKKGNIVEIKNGMEAKVSIISYKTTYFNYILEKVI